MNYYSLFVVDDEDDIRNGIVNTIDWHSLGFKIAGDAADGAEAIREIERIKPDVVLSDIRMPGADGVELMTHVHDKLPETKIVVLSGYSDFSYMESSIRNGVSAYLLKPTDVDAFKETFQRLHESIDEERRAIAERRRMEEYVKDSPAYIREKLRAQGQFYSANEKLASVILDYIEREYTSKKLSLRAISAYVKKNPAYVSKVFKSVTGDNYIRYVSKKRLGKAMELLKNSQMLVYQVTEAVGWTDQSSFIRLFKKEFGITPSQVSRMKSV